MSPGTAVAIGGGMEVPRAPEYRFVVERIAGEEVLRRAAGHLAPDVHAPTM